MKFSKFFSFQLIVTKFKNSENSKRIEVRFSNCLHQQFQSAFQTPNNFASNPSFVETLCKYFTISPETVKSMKLRLKINFSRKQFEGTFCTKVRSSYETFTLKMWKVIFNGEAFAPWGWLRSSTRDSWMWFMFVGEEVSTLIESFGFPASSLFCVMLWLAKQMTTGPLSDIESQAEHESASFKQKKCQR